MMKSVGNTGQAYLTVTALLVAGFLALVVDLPVSGFCLAGKVPGELRDFLSCAETFGNGYGVLLIALSIRILDPTRSRKLPRVFMCAYGAGMAANILKVMIPRVRPHHFDFQDAKVVDRETESSWDLFTGAALSGPLQGKHLTRLPGLVSDHNAWFAFHRDTELRLLFE